jgi:hypothetical protein
MEPLHLLFKKAHQQGLLQSLSSDCDTFRVSLYADDAALFINPSQQELQVTNHILQIFADVSGLKTNLAKTQCYPIQCQEINLDFIALSGHEASSFPCIYLGLPMHIRNPSKMGMQPLLQKVGDRLLGWKRKFMSYPGRELLVKTVLSSIPTHFLTVFKLGKWILKGIDHFRRSFLWKGADPNRIKGGQCLVNWQTYTMPRKWGGLGIKDLEKFGRALRLRWLWLMWDPQDRPWKHLHKVKDPIDRSLFFSSTFMQVGMGKLLHSGRQGGSMKQLLRT